MTEEKWHRARLIPTGGISGQDEAESRATSALLAITSIVRDFGLSLVKPLGAPASSLETFTEVSFEIGDRKVRPDGLIRTKRGSKQWTALVEVKTGSASLQREQVEAYLDVARQEGFDAVLTISNEISQAPGVHPTAVDKRRLKKVALHHYSWSEILTMAVQHRVHRKVSDPEQAWILAELIRYLEASQSGAKDFSDMGEGWPQIRESVVAGTLRPSDKGLGEVVLNWERLLQFAALRMGRELGADVQVVLSRKELAEPNLRLASQTIELVERGQLTGALRIPQAIADVVVVANLRSGRHQLSMDVEAPSEGKQITKVNWLLRQLKDAPASLRIDSLSHMSRQSLSELLSRARLHPEKLVEDPKRNIRVFTIAQLTSLGSNRTGKRGSFIGSVLSPLSDFYEQVVQVMRPWVAKAPQLPPGGRSAVEEAGIDITPPPVEPNSPLGFGGVEPDVLMLQEGGGPSPERSDASWASDSDSVGWDAPAVEFPDGSDPKGEGHSPEGAWHEFQ